jgi:hypothetical protein
MKLMSYSSIVLAGALLTFGSIASAADEQSSSTKKATSKSSSAGKTTVATAVAQVPDQVIYVKVTGSLIPQRYVVRNGQIVNTSTNTQLILLNGANPSTSVGVGNILAQNVPDIKVTNR